MSDAPFRYSITDTTGSDRIDISYGQMTKRVVITCTEADANDERGSHATVFLNPEHVDELITILRYWREQVITDD